MSLPGRFSNSQRGNFCSQLFRYSVLLPVLLVWTALSQAETVTIAIAGPMIGTSSSVGVQYRVGVEAAISSLPQGRLLGAEVDVITRDDSCKSDIAEVVARQIVTEQPKVVIGHSCSNATIASAPIYAAAGILQITPASTNPQVTEMGISTLLRMIGRDDLQGELAAERLATDHANEAIGILRFPGTYSQGLTRIAMSALAQRGIQPTMVVEASPSSSSYIAQIEQLTQGGVDVVYLVGGGLDSAVFARQHGQLKAPFSIVSGDTLVSRKFIETAGVAGEGIPFTFPPDPTRLTTSKSAVERITSRGGNPGGYTLLAYAAAEVWFEGVRRAGSFETAEVVTAIRESPIETALGQISFDEKGDIRTPYAPFQWFAWRNSQRMPLE
jgi:branched-chain amino acid transport system substrate-binding protein